MCHGNPSSNAFASMTLAMLPQCERQIRLSPREIPRLPTLL
jgi:hypothetical protein